MADIEIDLTADEGEFSVTNAHVFDIRLNFPGLQIDLSPEQAEQVFNGLRPFYEDPTPKEPK